MTKKAILYRMEIGTQACPFGFMAKDLLERNGYEIEEHVLTTRADTDEFKKLHSVSTTPQTFIDGKRIGGFDDLSLYFE